MLSISEYNKFFMKRSFNLPEYTVKYKKSIKIEYDKLFYSIFNKMNEHDITHINYNIHETQEKIKIAEKLDALKFKNKEFIMNNLMYDKIIHIKTFNALCMYYKLNVLFIKDNTYIKMFYSNSGSEDPSSILTMNENYQFVDLIDISNKYEINLDKPLKSVGTYKLEDLRDISKMLHLPWEGLKKQQLFDSIKFIIDKLNI